MRRLIVFVAVALPTIAFAQTLPACVQCKATETHSECHARLHCRADEELETCQKRIAAAANDDRTGRDQRNADDRSGRDQRGDDRGGRDDRGDDRRDDRGDDRGDDRRGRDDRGDDRDYREDDRGRRGRGRSSRHRQGGGGGGFEANKTFGLGIELGEPSGLTGKLFVSPKAELDFGIGY
jgi:hypothetical protein